MFTQKSLSSSQLSVGHVGMANSCRFIKPTKIIFFGACGELNYLKSIETIEPVTSSVVSRLVVHEALKRPQEKSSRLLVHLLSIFGYLRLVEPEFIKLVL